MEIRSLKRLSPCKADCKGLFLYDHEPCPETALFALPGVSAYENEPTFNHAHKTRNRRLQGVSMYILQTITNPAGRLENTACVLRGLFAILGAFIAYPCHYPTMHPGTILDGTGTIWRACAKGRIDSPGAVEGHDYILSYTTALKYQARSRQFSSIFLRNPT